MEIKKVTEKREHCADGEEEKWEGKERVVPVRLRPSRMSADAGKEPDTRRDTRTLAHCGTLPSCISHTLITSLRSAHHTAFVYDLNL